MNLKAPDLETLVWTILACGLLLSVSLILSGLVWEWIASGTLRTGPPILAVNLRGLLAAVIAGSSSGLTSVVLLDSGIAVLLLTPYTRVLASVFFFTFKDHNYRYSAITGFVAAVLTWVLFLRG
jgi:uncharacterized membrane protein